MKFIAIREIDKLGRILLPIDVRRFYGILPGDEICMSLKENAIIVSKDIKANANVKTVDKIGRIHIPKKIREHLNSIVKIVPLDNEIHLYSADEFKDI